MAHQMGSSSQDRTYWILGSRGDEMWLPSKNERVTARIPYIALGTQETEVWACSFFPLLPKWGKKRFRLWPFSSVIKAVVWLWLQEDDSPILALRVLSLTKWPGCSSSFQTASYGIDSSTNIAAELCKGRVYPLLPHYPFFSFASSNTGRYNSH